MRFGALKVCGFVAAFSGFAPAAVAQHACGSEWPVSGQELVHLSTILKRNVANPLPKASRIELGYVLPRGQFETGAIAIKVRHRYEPGNGTNGNGFPGGSEIRLERPRYTSPCDKRPRRKYSQDVKLERYVDQHYYGISHTSMDEFHAEIGARRRPFLIVFERGLCRSTNDAGTRGHFLFSEHPSIATPGETINRRAAIAARNSTFIPEAFADQAKNYRDKLQTSIISYVRPNLVSESCVPFGLEIPKGSGITEVEIFDIDTAHSKSRWELKWGQD